MENLSSLQLIRVIDANLNRLAEGLRVLDEIARLILDDAGLSQQLKKLRHDLIRGDLAFNTELLQSRNSVDDVGIDLEVKGEARTKDLSSIVVANAHRTQESLRVLEEMAKLPELAGKLDSDKFKHARFELYTLEQKLVSRLLRREKVQKVKGLYVILDTQALNGRSHLEVAQQVIRAGVKVIQLRDKTTPKKQLIPLARELQKLCTQNNVLFIVNDYLDIALAIQADGLHIGQADLTVEDARRLLPMGAILGVSASTIIEAKDAEVAGADYIGVGGIFPTASKSDVELVGVERITQIRQALKIPLVAIGGINQNNTLKIIQAGADSVCVIAAVLNAPDVTEAARAIIKLIEDNNEKTNR